MCKRDSLVGEQGNYAQAEKYFEQGLTIARQIANIEWESLLLLNLGVSLQKQTKFIQAEKYLKQGLDLVIQIGIPQMVSNALYELGNLYLNQLLLQIAEEHFNKMLNVTPEGNQDLIALAQYGIARIAAIQGKLSEAQTLGETSLATLKAMGNRNAIDVRNWLDSAVKSKY